MKPAPTRRYPLYIHLSVLFSALVLAAGSAIAWLGYVESAISRSPLPTRLFGHIAREAHVSLRESLQPVANFAEILALEPIARAQFARRTAGGAAVDAARIRRRGTGRGVYVGYDDGSFFLLRPLRDERARALFAAPDGSAFLVQSGGDRPRRRAAGDLPLPRRVAARARAPRPGPVRSTRARGPGTASPPSRASACSPTPTSSPRPRRRA